MANIRMAWNKIKNPRYFYHYLKGRRILGYKMIHNKKSDLEIHTLLCHKDLIGYLWSIRSFFFFSKIDAEVVIHEDGSLTEKDIAILRRQIKNIRIIRKETADRKTRVFLKKYPFCRKYRFGKEFILSLKLFDPYIFSKSKRIIILDSDIIFFKEPTELKHWKEGNMFMQEMEESQRWFPYSFTRGSKFKISHSKTLNSGLLFIQKEYLDLPIIEKYLSEGFDMKTACWIEQTAFSILASKGRWKGLDPLRYDITLKSENAVAKHFTQLDRNNMFTKAIPKLKIY